jgi:hypothetical protein
MNDYLQFESDLFDGGMFRCGWGGAWPPPEKFGVLVGELTDYVSIYDPEDVKLDASALEEAKRIARHMMFERVSFSRLPDDLEATHVARGALYRRAMEP